jgi:hypothetical protein
LERIQTLTAELEAVQAEIYGQITEPSEMLARRMLLEDRSSAQVLDQFRTALDKIRNVLWLCTEGSTADSQQRHALSRPGGVVRTLSANARPEPSPRRLTRETVSFFDRLDRVIDTYMQESGTIVDPAHGKPPKT